MMRANQTWPIGPPPPAVILLLAETRSPLWDPAVHRLVDEVETGLRSALVSFAVAAGRGPSLADALAAVRFVGCSAVAVVATPEVGPATVARCLADARSDAHCEVLRCSREAPVIVDRCRRWLGDGATERAA